MNFPKPDEIHTIVFDFDGVFTDNKVWITEDGKESVCCDRSDGYAFDLFRYYLTLHNLNINFFILSKESNNVVSSRAKKLRLPLYKSIDNKRDFIKKYFEENFLGNKDPFSGMIYLGNDLNDLPVMLLAGFSIAPSDSHPAIKKIASHVLSKKGGDGFVRSFIEHFLNIHNMNKEELDELISNC